MATPSESEGAWVFVSHSNKDFARVRAIRNALEVKGHYPLLFFLKCLGDDAEVHELIRREIEARSWFLLCNSENARQSRWVQQEMEIIRAAQDKVFREVDLERQSLEQQIEIATRLARQATAYLACAAADRATAATIHRALRAHDIGVFWDLADLESGPDWQVEIGSAVEDAARHGWIVLLLSAAATASPWVLAELAHARAIAQDVRLLPVLLDAPDRIMERLPAELRNFVRGYQWLDFTREPSTQGLSSWFASSSGGRWSEVSPRARPLVEALRSTCGQEGHEVVSEIKTAAEQGRFSDFRW
jgi:TIR domain